MVVKTDEQGKKLIEALCDVALKAGGLSNLQAVGSILNAVEILEEPKTSEAKADES